MRYLQSVMIRVNFDPFKRSRRMYVELEVPTTWPEDLCFVGDAHPQANLSTKSLKCKM